MVKIGNALYANEGFVITGNSIYDGFQNRMRIIKMQSEKVAKRLICNDDRHVMTICALLNHIRTVSGRANEDLKSIELTEKKAVFKVRDALTAIIFSTFATEQKLVDKMYDEARNMINNLVLCAKQAKDRADDIGRRLFPNLFACNMDDPRIEDVIKTALNLCESTAISCKPYVNAHAVRISHEHEEVLTRILLNIFSNAFEAMMKKQYATDEKPSLKVFTDVYPSAVGIEIKDNGIGMSTDMLEQIFVNRDLTMMEGRTGKGINLCNAKSIVKERLHGSIEIKSNVGSGTTVYLQIPIK